jgi:hypothetical protein
MAEWTIDPSKFVQGTIDDIDKVRRIYAFEIFRRVVEKTPVDTGAARQNWNVTLNQEDTSYDLEKEKGGRVMSNGRKAIKSAKDDDLIIIQNNVPYITKLEYGGYGKHDKNGKLIQPSNGPKTISGYSRQAPHGMVGVVLAQAEQLFQAAVNAVKGGGA